MNSHYYDQPEGKDAFGKMIAANRFAGTAGLTWATVDVLMVSKTQGYLPTMARYAVVTAPFIACASAFTMGTYIATNVRNKDDRWNYVIGGFMAGAAYGAVKRSVVSGLTSGLFFAIAASLKKLSKQEGWEFFPEPKTHGLGGLRSHNYTLMAERPRNWTTGKE